MQEIQLALDLAHKEFQQKEKRNIIERTIVYKNLGAEQHNPATGSNFASITVELVSPDQRKTTNAEFIKKWRSLIILAHSIEIFSNIANKISSINTPIL